MKIFQKIDVIIDAVCREPFRLFFPLGIWMGFVGLSPWLFYALGWAENYSSFFHSSTQMLVYMKKSINRDIKIKKTGIIPISWEKVNKKGYLGGLNLGRLRKNLGVINNWQNRIRLRYR